MSSARLTTSCSAPAAVASESHDGPSRKDKVPSPCGIHAALRCAELGR